MGISQGSKALRVARLDKGGVLDGYRFAHRIPGGGASMNVNVHTLIAPEATP